MIAARYAQSLFAYYSVARGRISTYIHSNRWNYHNESTELFQRPIRSTAVYTMSSRLFIATLLLVLLPWCQQIFSKKNKQFCFFLCDDLCSELLHLFSCMLANKNAAALHRSPPLGHCGDSQRGRADLFLPPTSSNTGPRSKLCAVIWSSCTNSTIGAARTRGRATRRCNTSVQNGRLWTHRGTWAIIWLLCSLWSFDNHDN